MFKAIIGAWGMQFNHKNAGESTRSRAYLEGSYLVTLFKACRQSGSSSSSTTKSSLSYSSSSCLMRFAPLPASTASSTTQVHYCLDQAKLIHLIAGTCCMMMSQLLTSWHCKSQTDVMQNRLSKKQELRNIHLRVRNCFNLELWLKCGSKWP